VAQSTVRLIVDASNAINPLKRVNDATKNLSKNTDKLKNRLDKGKKSFDKFGNSGKKASSNVNSLVGTLKKLAVAFAAIQTAKFVFFKTAELETQRKSLEVLTGSLENTNKIIKELQDFGAVTPFTSSELIEQTKRLKAFGIETNNLVDTTKRLSDIAGATGADLTGIATAFGQIRAKGKLQQEENLQLLERGVDITTELKRITGLQGDEFESAMRKGELGADLVNQAMINLTNEGGAFFGGATAQSGTLNGKLSTLQDTIDTLARTIGTELQDEIKGVIDIAIEGVKAIDDLVKRIATANKVGRPQIAGFAMEARKEATEIVRGEVGLLASLLPENQEKIRLLAEEIKNRKINFALMQRERELEEKKKNALKPLDANNNIAPTYIGRNPIQAAMIRDEKTPLKENEELTAKMKANIKDFASGIVGVIKLENDREEAFKKYIDKQEQSGELLQAAIDGNVEEVQLRHEINEAVDKFGIKKKDEITKILTANQGLRDQKTEIDKNAEAAEALKAKFDQIGNEIKNGIVQNLTDAVMGTQTLAESAINVLERLRRKLIEVAIQKALAGLGGMFGGGGFGGFLGGLFGRANGGRVSANQPYMVGERGREVFVPTTSGTIVPNNQLGGGNTNVINVSVDASGTQAEGDEATSSQLGKLIGLAVQQELVKQSRAGGLLSRA
jgi:tape measure domain-containing protein